MFSENDFQYFNVSMTSQNQKAFKVFDLLFRRSGISQELLKSAPRLRFNPSIWRLLSCRKL